MDNQTACRRGITYIVSSCLVGLKTRYDGTDKLTPSVKDLVEAGLAIPFCPEQGGGLPTPRKPAEIVSGDGYDVLAGRATVLTRDGRNVTREFIAGAQAMLALARIVGAKIAIIKSLSPSCGVGTIYDGTFSGTIKEGDGVTTALLKQAGLTVITEKELADD